MPIVQPPPPNSRADDITFPDGTGGPASSVGMTPIGGSGVTSALCPGLGTYDSSGPWWIETQTLQFDYMRTPHGYQNSIDMSLSAVDATLFLHHTSLAVRVTARVTAISSTDNYCTSAWTQNQKFELVSVSADASGNTYGGGTDASTMGPMGSVVTKTEYYHRRPFVAGTDTPEFSQDIAEPAYNYRTWTEFTKTPRPNSQVWGQYLHFFCPTTIPGSPLGVYDPWSHVWPFVYSLPGGYNINAETSAKLWEAINDVGNYVQTENLAIDYDSDWQGPGKPYTMIGCPAYDPNRHDFT